MTYETIDLDKLASLPASLLRNILDDYEKSLQEKTRADVIDARLKQKAENILTSDAALQECKVQGDLRILDEAPLVRAYTYKEIEKYQEVGNMICGQNFSKFWHNDSRRPVLMRGSLFVLAFKNRVYNSYSNWTVGYARKVVFRYLKFIKYSETDRERYWEFMLLLKSRLMDKGLSLDVVNGYDRFFSEYYVGVRKRENSRGEWRDGVYIEEPLPSVPTHTPYRARYGYATQKREERAILRSVKNLGLIREGDFT